MLILIDLFSATMLSHSHRSELESIYSYYLKLLSISARHHRCVKVKSGKIVVLLKIFLNKATSDCFVNLSPIVTIFSIQVNNYIVHISHHFGCHGNHLVGMYMLP